VVEREAVSLAFVLGGGQEEVLQTQREFSRELRSLMAVPLELVVLGFRSLILLLFVPPGLPADVGSRI
jgi:hypothetical protein